VVREPDKQVLADFLELMEFRSLARRVGDGNASAAPRTLGPLGDRPPSAPTAPVLGVSYMGAAARAAANPVAEPASIDHAAYVRIQDLETLNAWVAKATAKGIVAFDTETDALSSATAGLCGVSLAIAPGEACYIPVGHCEKDGLALEAAADLVQIPLEEAIAALKPLLEDPAVLKVAQNAKYDIAVLARHGINVGPIEDTMLISYVLEAGLHGHGMDELSELWLGHKPIPFKQVAGSGKGQISFKHVGLTEATAYAAEDADVTLRLYKVLKPRLAREGLLTVYETLERPLPSVLAAMENDGIRVDPDTLRRLSNEFSMRMAQFEARAQELVGRPFNLGSPKQIGDVLFGEMQLKGGKKTATGQWSTDSDVLEALALEHELPRVLLDWRQLSKLKGTYTENLIAAIAPGGGNRVHTSYALASTTTGRLSSSDPNLQNIPIRTEEGRKIRKAFVAAPGKVLISADYSQIELRLLAHIGDIPQLKKAFQEGPGHPRHDRVGDVQRADRGHAQRGAPPGQGDQFRHRLRHQRPSAWPTSCRSRRARPGPISRPISSASPASRPIWRRPRPSCASTAMSPPSSGGRSTSPTSAASRWPTGSSPSGRRSTPRSRGRRPTSCAGPWSACRAR
jgi:DNA polymerase-1